jgi:esterase
VGSPRSLRAAAGDEAISADGGQRHARRPALFIGGGKSRYLLPKHESAIHALFPRATVARIEDAGHLLHVERAEAFLSLTQKFLDS